MGMGKDAMVCLSVWMDGWMVLVGKGRTNGLLGGMEKEIYVKEMVIVS